MHFRHFLLPTLMLGAALFLPENALAEKSEQNGPPSHSNKEIVQTVKTIAAPATVVENAKPLEKTQQAKAVKQVPSPAAPKQAVSPQAASEAAKALPAQANGNGYGLSDTSEKTVIPPGQEIKSAVQNKDSAGEPEQLNNKPEPEVKNKVKPTKPQSQQEEADISDSVGIEPPAQLPAEKDTAPSSKEKLPPVDQTMNPTQRSNNTGGSGKDRVSTGSGTTSLLDKWLFDWNKYGEMKLVQPFLARYALMNTQWVNAPPSPPPQAAPFLKTVNRS